MWLATRRRTWRPLSEKRANTRGAIRVKQRWEVCRTPLNYYILADLYVNGRENAGSDAVAVPQHRTRQVCNQCLQSSAAGGTSTTQLTVMPRTGAFHACIRVLGGPPRCAGCSRRLFGLGLFGRLTVLVHVDLHWSMRPKRRCCGLAPQHRTLGARKPALSIPGDISPPRYTRRGRET